MTPKKGRLTRQLLEIMHYLKSTTTHPTAAEVYQHVRRKLPKISLGTVYRNLDKLTNEGLIQKLESAGVRNRYDGNPLLHYHLKCCRCGQLFDLDVKPIRQIEKVADKLRGFKFLGYRLEFIGVCSNCLKLVKRKGGNYGTSRLKDRS